MAGQEIPGALRQPARSVTWKLVLAILGIFVLSASLPIAGVTIGVRLWRAGGAWSKGPPAMSRMELPFQTDAAEAVPVAPDDSQASNLVYEGIDQGIVTRVSVTPTRPLAGKVQLHVRPVVATDRTPLTGATIEVFAGMDGNWQLKAPALNTPVDRTLYVANLELDEPGRWVILVHVRSEATAGQVKLGLDILPRARSGGNLWLASLAYAGAVAAIVAGVLWLVRSARKARAPVNP